MTQIQTGRYEQFSRRLLRLVGGSIMPRLQNDLSPVLNIEDPADDALLFWKGHRLAMGYSLSNAVAARFSSCSLFNPLGSGALIVVLNATVLPGAGATIQASFSQTRTTGVQATLSFTDTRASLVSVPRGEVGEDDFAAAPAHFNRMIGPGSVYDQFPLRVVLSPGVGLFLTNTVANTNLQASFIWLERTAETSELESA